MLWLVCTALRSSLQRQVDPTQWRLLYCNFSSRTSLAVEVDFHLATVASDASSSQKSNVKRRASKNRNGNFARPSRVAQFRCGLLSLSLSLPSVPRLRSISVYIAFCIRSRKTHLSGSSCTNEDRLTRKEECIRERKESRRRIVRKKNERRKTRRTEGKVESNRKESVRKK